MVATPSTMEYELNKSSPELVENVQQANVPGTPPDVGDEFVPESWVAKYVPGGYSRGRLLPLSGKPMTYAILALAGTAILFFGYDASVMSQVNTNGNYLQVMGLDHGTPRDATALGGLVSIWYAGFAIGAILVGFIGDKIGRLRTAMLGCFWAILGACLQASAQSITWMMFARLIGGVGCGHLNTVIPIWTSEVADAHLRGAFIAVEFTMALCGSTLVYWLEYGISQGQNLSFAWRFPIAFQMVPLLFVMIALPFFPESPRHLMQIGQVSEARYVLQKCRLDPEPDKIEQEVAEIREVIRLERTGSAHSYWSMISKTDALRTRKRVVLGVGIQVMNKLTGVDFIATYGPSVFSLSGFSKNKSALLAGGNFFGYTLSLFVSIFLVDRIGRRAQMMWGSCAMGIMLIIGGVVSHEVFQDVGVRPDEALKYGTAVVIMLYLYTFTYGASWLAVAWVYPTEIFPLSCRTKGTALSTIGWSIAGGVINEIIPYLVRAVTFWTFILFAITNFLLVPVVYLFYIETANRHLEEADHLFSSPSVFAFKAEREYREKTRNPEEADSA